MFHSHNRLQTIVILNNLTSAKALLKRLPGMATGLRLVRRSVAISRRLSVPSGARRRALTIETVPTLLKVPDQRQRFVGYYDHSPFKPDDERLLLVHSTRHPPWRRPSPQVPVHVELINHQTGMVVRELGQSLAWNWQQGARALWLDSETVIFNVYDVGMDRFRARLVTCDGTHRGDLPIPVQEVDSRGRVYSLSYESLAAIRPDYGYRNRLLHPNDLTYNAIERFDPASEEYRVLMRLSDLRERTEVRHGHKVKLAKFNHIMASPDSTRLVFLFRYLLDERRVTDLYEMSTGGGQPRLLVEDGGVSHVCWWGDHAVVATMHGTDGFGYYFVSVDDRRATRFWEQLDGHPSPVDERWLLTDTYPDQYALRRLLIRSLENEEVVEVGAFPEPLLFQGETRCDLHPSLSPSGRYIQVDCALGHRRTVAVLPNPLLDGSSK